VSHYFDTGYSVRQPAWHGLADVHEGYPENWDQARQWAGLTWEPESEPMWARRLTDQEQLAGIQAILENTPEGERAAALADQFAGSLMPVKGYQRIYRSDDITQTLGCPTGKYQIVNHTAYGEILMAVLEQDNLKYETAGSVENGKCTWALVLLDEPIMIGKGRVKDKSATLPYVALTARHDGMGAVRAQATTVRIVCANTVKAAETESDANGTVFSFPHTGNWEDRVEQARAAIAGVKNDIRAYTEWAQAMLGIKISKEQEERFIVEFIPMPPDSLISDRVAKNVEEARHAVRVFLASETVEGAGVRGTGYGLYQAAVEHLDWGRKAQSAQSRFNRQLLQHDPIKAQASQLIHEIAGA